ncbi:hypothetical protein T484DRAFT_1922605, partial [Baffinella frigidus]
MRPGWPRRVRCGRGAPPRSRCLLPSAPEEKEGRRPTQMVSEALRCCRRRPPARWIDPRPGSLPITASKS